ncbi:MAG TPA: glutaredoxin [Ruminococcaceae bacterium]|nr:glutaredoxin [Oscillospiraceae bacterium]
MKKVIMYGSPMCGDCVEAKKVLEEEQIRYGYVDVTAGMAHLKKFLNLRDNRPEFDAVKEEGKIGIPCFVVDDKDLYIMLPEDLDVLR